eukprot:9536785-Alexandrium_andersonii.AAC.1
MPQPLAVAPVLRGAPWQGTNGEPAQRPNAQSETRNLSRARGEAASLRSTGPFRHQPRGPPSPLAGLGAGRHNGRRLP